MEAKILSLNSSHPSPLEWKGKVVQSSIVRAPVSGPLVVHKNHIEGNSYGVPTAHGLEHKVLYAFGVESAIHFARRIELEQYEPGLLGENVTLDRFDETLISLGDVFEFGEVLAQAVYPRIPCSRVNFRLQREDALKALQDCGRSGVYFRILRPGKIFLNSHVRRVEKTPHRFPIFDLYRTLLDHRSFDLEEKQRGIANGAFPSELLEKWKVEISAAQ
jgi:MOSC domain-containing protein YiiM